jgi:MinD superfamily P-loop ATPase
VQAIRISSGWPQWEWNCEGCLRCINQCPCQAIQISAVRFLASIGLLMSLAWVWNQRLIPAGLFAIKGNVFNVISNILLNITLFGMLLAIIDWLLFKLGCLPGLRSIVGWGYTRFFKRYTVKPFEDRFLKK